LPSRGAGPNLLAVILKRLPVDLAPLTQAFDEPRGGPVRTFVDRQTGAIEHVPLDAEVEGVFDDIFASPERWLEVQPLAPPLRQDLRRRFVQQVDDPQLRLRLGAALGERLPLQRFASVLRERPALLDAWLLFRQQELDSLIRAWLAALGIEPIQAGGDQPPPRR
jgi:hypothetical protein